ncbi:hypothetical protein EVAR_30469_1 [Eumeta japonica]|uniref:Uncharacterized protein n=1 Tax=Eumeta variegata TaxID=151549 RepID=A0A4C1VYW5_EUMVA|nr:hypothetical protein EVAR_30469_1 [Eumeta japonica]
MTFAAPALPNKLYEYGLFTSRTNSHNLRFTLNAVRRHARGQLANSLDAAPVPGRASNCMCNCAAGNYDLGGNIQFLDKGVSTQTARAVGVLPRADAIASRAPVIVR